MVNFNLRLTELTSVLLVLLLAFLSDACASNSISKDSVNSLNDNTKIVFNSENIRDGGILEIRLQTDLSPDQVEGKIFNTKLTFFKVVSSPGSLFTEWVAYVGVPYEKSPGKYNVEVFLNVGGERIEKYSHIMVMDHNYPSENLRVEPGKVFLSKEDRERTARERAMMKEIYQNSISQRLWLQRFKKPINSKQTSIYGTKRMFNGKAKGQHLGADFRAGTGRKIRVTNRGKVVFAGNLFYSGNLVVVDHGLGVFTFYGHLSKILVSKGQMLVRGSLVGRAGATGRVTGPHLHWGAKITGHSIDPMELLKLNL